MLTTDILNIIISIIHVLIIVKFVLIKHYAIDAKKIIISLDIIEHIVIQEKTFKNIILH